MVHNRRETFRVLAAALAAPSCVLSGLVASNAARAQSPAMSRITAYAFSFAGIDGGDIRLADFAGKPILIVNTASQCGYTPQFAGLQQLYTRFHDKGLNVVGVPSNDFGGQEPGTAADIMFTAHDEYGVRFPIAAKVEVRGRNPHPFYRWAATERPLETPRWNFHKYLVGRDGRIAAVFPTDIEPMDARVAMAIGKEL
jgi:glutathione peroxidase